MYRPSYIIFSTGLFRPDIFARPHQEVLVHCRLVHCGLVRCRLKLVLLRILFSDLKADVFSCVGRWKIVLYSLSDTEQSRHVEQLCILHPPSLNKRRELFSTCPHRKKHLLLNLKIVSEEEQSSNGNAPSRSAPIGNAPRPPDEDGRKCPAETGL